jgi:hypothetical protein
MRHVSDIIPPLLLQIANSTLCPRIKKERVNLLREKGVISYEVCGDAIQKFNLKGE